MQHKKLESEKINFKYKYCPEKFGVTVVITSCERYPLLDRTLESFLCYNSFPVERIIVVEDGPNIDVDLVRKYHTVKIEWISTGQRVGQIAAIDYAYSRITTPYIFHMEDDWEFYNRGFISKSMQLLRFDPTCLQVWLRAIDDTNGHPFDDPVYSTHGISWRRLVLDFHGGNWNGFSFNPGLRRLCDYIQTGGFGNLTRFNFHKPLRSEMEIGRYFRSRGFYSAILCDLDGQGYVRHTGDDYKTKPPKILEGIQ